MIGKVKGRAKDVYGYLECLNCGNIFRIVKSGMRNSYSICGLYLAECPRCGYVKCEKTTKKEWIKSNEMIPDRRSS